MVISSSFYTFAELWTIFRYFFEKVDHETETLKPFLFFKCKDRIFFAIFTGFPFFFYGVFLALRYIRSLSA
jgi:hypothetical protein